jgi:hypothetical protein
LSHRTLLSRHCYDRSSTTNSKSKARVVATLLRHMAGVCSTSLQPTHLDELEGVTLV